MVRVPRKMTKKKSKPKTTTKKKAAVKTPAVTEKKGFWARVFG